MERPPSTRDAVLAWRRDLLMHAGCQPALAWELAARRDIDLHDFLNLIDRGCPPHLAARIVAPLDCPALGCRGKTSAVADAERV